MMVALETRFLFTVVFFVQDATPAFVRNMATRMSECPDESPIATIGSRRLMDMRCGCLRIIGCEIIGANVEPSQFGTVQCGCAAGRGFAATLDILVGRIDELTHDKACGRRWRARGARWRSAALTRKSQAGAGQQALDLARKGGCRKPANSSANRKLIRDSSQRKDRARRPAKRPAPA